MQPDEFDAAYVLDMLNAAERLMGFMAGKTREQFELDEMLRAAVERKTEIIGEAARRLSRSFKKANPQIPWRAIVATRHILVHEYNDVKNDIVWRIATTHVPELVTLLRALLPPLDPPANPASPD